VLAFILPPPTPVHTARARQRQCRCIRPSDIRRSSICTCSLTKKIRECVRRLAAIQMPLGSGQPILAARAALSFIVFISANAPPARDPPFAESLNMSVATRAEPFRFSQIKSGAVTGFGCVAPIMFSLWPVTVRTGTDTNEFTSSRTGLRVGPNNEISVD
jgi:hypothetical protein